MWGPGRAYDRVVSSFEGLLAWMRGTVAEAKARPLEACPRCGFGLRDVGGVLWCAFDGWRSDVNG